MLIRLKLLKVNERNIQILVNTITTDNMTVGRYARAHENDT